MRRKREKVLCKAVDNSVWSGGKQPTYPQKKKNLEDIEKVIPVVPSAATRLSTGLKRTQVTVSKGVKNLSTESGTLY